MTPHDVIRDAKQGDVKSVYLLVGEEHRQQAAVLEAVRAAVLAGGVPGLNDDVFVAGESDVEAILDTARTVPMMASRRLLTVRHLERWDKKRETGKDAAKGRGEPLDRLAEYAAAPIAETTMVLLASKLDKRRRLGTTCKKAGFLVDCTPLSRDALPRWIETTARERGNTLAPGVAHLLAELAGPELGNVADALERVCLYVGEGAEVTEDAVGECVVRLRPATVWQLVDTIGRRDMGGALALLSDVYDPRDRGLPLLGALAWSARQLVKFESAVRDGASPQDAAKRAGAPPFKARDLARQVKRFSRPELERWIETLAAVDRDLKGGSRKPPLAILEQAVVSMCQTGKQRSAGRR